MTFKDNSGCNTTAQFKRIKSKCLEIFTKKLEDYGTSWRIMRPTSITDQIFIKANRIRTLEEKGNARINEGIESEFVGIVNYGVIGLIQLDLGASWTELDLETTKNLYNKWYDSATSLMTDKNHDYDEAWRQMRISSFTDIILTKIRRTKQIEDHNGLTVISEGIDANYMDMINYAIFALIQLGYADI